MRLSIRESLASLFSAPLSVPRSSHLPRLGRRRPPQHLPGTLGQNGPTDVLPVLFHTSTAADAMKGGTMRRVMGLVVVAVVGLVAACAQPGIGRCASCFGVMSEIQGKITQQVWLANGWAASPVVVEAVLAQNKKGPIPGMDNAKWKTVPEADAIVQGVSVDPRREPKISPEEDLDQHPAGICDRSFPPARSDSAPKNVCILRPGGQIRVLRIPSPTPPTPCPWRSSGRSRLAPSSRLRTLSCPPASS